MVENLVGEAEGLPHGGTMSQATAQPTKPRFQLSWRAWVPVVLAVGIAVLPVPAGLAPHAWYFFAIFAGVIAALASARAKKLRFIEGLSFP